MKKINLILCFIILLFACQNRSRKTQNRAQYPPEKHFQNLQLQAATEMYQGNLEAFTSTISRHPEIINQLSNNKGYTLLMYASIIEDLKAMEILLQNGADPNIIIPHLHSSPLTHAVGINDYRMLDLLIKYKVNLNPAVGSSPLHVAMFLGGHSTEQKMIDHLLKNGADINHTSYLGDNIMESATRGDLNTAMYFLSKGGNPKIKGTDLSPMAQYIQLKQEQDAKYGVKSKEYVEKLKALKATLQQKYGIVFPIVKDTIAEAQLRMKLYNALNERDKRSVNFNGNYGINRYKKDQEIVLGHTQELNKP